VAGAHALALTVVGLALFHAQRRVGVLPFAGYLALLAGAAVATVLGRTLAAGALGSAPLALAVGLPVLVALVVPVHLLHGTVRAQVAAAFAPLAAGLLAAVTGGAAMVGVPVWAATLGPDPGAALGTGAVLWVGPVLTSAVLAGIYRTAPTVHPFVGAALAAGLGLVAGAGTGTVLAGSPASPVPAVDVGLVYLPMLLGAAPILAVSGYATYRLAGLYPRARQALARGELDEGDPVERALDLQRQQEDAAAEDRRRADAVRDLVEEADHGAYVCEPEGRITYANRGLARLLGRAGDLQGSNVRHLFSGRDEHGRPRLADAPVMPGRHEVEVPLPDGGTLPVEVAVEPAGDEALLGRVRDRTEEQLRQRVEEQKERAEFYLDLLRHDIGNHVTTPLNYLQMLASREDLPADAERYVEASETAVREIADLLGRIDVLSEVDELEPEPVDLGAILRSVGARFEETHERLDLTYRLPEGSVVVAGSPLLEEVFGNLVGNAARHAGEDARVELGATVRGGEAVAWVADDGPGLTDEQKARVFGRAARDEQAGGDGLGLYIVETVVEGLDGDVRARDRVPGHPAQGACFEVHLPVVEGAGSADGHGVAGGGRRAGSAA